MPMTEVTPARTSHTALLRAGALSAGMALALAGCAGSGQAANQGNESGEGGLSVVASFYPLLYTVERVGGEWVDLEDLTPSGADPHDLELAPVDVATMDGADVLFYLSAFQPAVDDAVAQISGPTSVDVRDAARVQDTAATVRAAEGSGPPDDEHDDEDHADEEHGHSHDDEDHADGEPDEDHADQDDPHGEDDGHDHGPEDPHFWLDPTRLADVGDLVADALTEAAPEHAEEFATNAAELRADLEELDTEYAQVLDSCRQNVVVVSHTAFGYLAMRYDLEQVGIAGLDPEAEPSPARLAEIRQIVRAEGIDTLYTEAIASPQVTQVLADELDLEVAVLDPIEGLVDAETDYLSLMRANLDALTTGLGCS